MYDTTFEHEVLTNGAKVSEALLDNFNKVSFKRVADDAGDGVFEISMTNMSTKKNSTFKMDKDGNITLFGSTYLKVNIGDKATLEMDKSGSIKIVSLNDDVKISGNTDITGTLHVTGNITSDMDVIAKNCTLNTHVHKEMQSGDVVAAGVVDTSTGH